MLGMGKITSEFEGILSEYFGKEVVLTPRQELALHLALESSS